MSRLTKSFLYVLKADDYEDLILQDNPSGWEDQLVSIMRSPTYYGLFREVSTSLRFVGDGLQYVQDIYEQQGTEYEIRIGIYEYKAPPNDNYQLFFEGIIDLSTYSFEENFVECNINETSFARKLMSRDDVRVKLDALQSVEGETLPANSSVNVQLHQRNILNTAILQLNTQAATVEDYDSPIDSLQGFTLPTVVAASDLDNVQNSNTPELDVVGGQFWNPVAIGAGNAQNVTMIGTIKGTMGVAPTDTQNKTFRIAVRVYDDNTMTAYTDHAILWEFTGQLEEMPEVDLQVNTTINSVDEDNVIALVFYQTTTSIAGSFTCEFTEIDLRIEFAQNFDISYADGYLLHEAAQRITEVITDTQGQFYSELLGRVDLGYNEDGSAALQTLHSGKQIRAIPNSVASITLRKFFDGINAMRNIGIGIEYNAFGQPLLRLEEKKHFFSGNVIATINNVANVKKEVAREWIYSAVQVGYDKSEYEEVNGLEEFNNKFDFQTYIKTIKNEYDIVSTIRADGYGIEFARRKSYALFPTQDTEYDNDNFTIVVRWNGSAYVSAQDEQYDLVQNIFDPASAYNLDLSPGRMLRRHGYVLRAGLGKYLQQEIKFMYAEQKSNMYSQRTGDSAIDENANIDASTLDAGLWIPEIYSFESELTSDLLRTILANSNGIIKFSPTSAEKTSAYFYGWILKVEGNEETDEAVWKLLRVNTQSPNVTLIDPDGDTPDIDDPPVPPVISGGYEGSFEFVFTG